MYLGVQKIPTSPTVACISAGEAHQIFNSLLLEMNTDINLTQKADAYFPASIPKLDVAQTFPL